MQLVTGSRVLPTTANDIVTWTQGYERVALDLGAGDGRYVANLAQKSPDSAVIGVDLCAANMASASRKAGANARFLVADACTLPEEIIAIADQITIAFPWGSLLRGILGEGGALVPRLVHAMRAGARLEIVINADASGSCGLDLSTAESRITTALSTAGGTRPRVTKLDADNLKTGPSTWAKRLAFGRDPHAIAITSNVLAGSKRSASTYARPATLYHLARGSVSTVTG